MDEWLDTVTSRPSHEYLKDWHLQLLYTDKQDQHNPSQNADTTRNDQQQLFYNVPSIFQHDLLNDFLTTFTNGDYRFVYWGPAGSQTTRHSDVLNSFSWSYNVCGEKVWRFFVPTTNDQDNNRGSTNQEDTVSSSSSSSSSSLVLTVHQSAGEAIFVPAGWQHAVVNTVDTISINHNWITTANLDLVIDCILSELGAVRKECSEWGITSAAAQESMLRGCVGLGLTSLFFLIVKGLLDMYRAAETNKHHDDEFDEKSLQCGLLRLLDPEWNLEQVLAATLGYPTNNDDDKDGNVAKQCIHLAEELVGTQKGGERREGDEMSTIKQYK